MYQLHMRKHNGPGLLFTFCGLDGCGKTTMIRRAVEELEHSDALLLTKQPTDFVRNSAIFRTYMDSPDHSAYDYRALSLLAASDRIQHTSKVILPALQGGKTVISDRYFYSCLANLIARGYASDEWIYEIAASLIAPDVAFFFDVPVEVAISRVRQRPAERTRYIDENLQYRLREAYLNIAKANNGVVISTTLSPDETYLQVHQAIQNAKKKKGI